MKHPKISICAITLVTVAVALVVHSKILHTSRPSMVRISQIVTVSGERLPNFFHGLMPSPVNDYWKVAGTNRPRPTCGGKKSSFFWRLLGGTTVHAQTGQCFQQPCSGEHFETYAIECTSSFCNGDFDHGRQNINFPG